MHLNWCRLARKHTEAVSAGMAGQIDQDIDAIGADLSGETIVGTLRGVAPAIGDPLKFAGSRIPFRSTRVAHDLELCPIIVLQDRLENERRRMCVKIRRDITQPQTAIRI